MDTVISQIESLGRPIDFLDPTTDLKDRCVSILPHLFSFTTKLYKPKGTADLALSEMHVAGFGLEDLWEQIELINGPLFKHLKQRHKLDLKSSQCVPLLDVTFEEHLYKKDQVQDSDNEDEEESKDEDEGMELDDELEDESDNEGVDEKEEDDDDESMENGGEGVGTEVSSQDRFFSLTEMEEFVRMVEEKETREAKKDSDHESIDLFDEDAGEEERDLDEFEQESENMSEQFFYKDFFDPPPPAVTSVSSAGLDLPLSSHQKRQKQMDKYIARLEATSLENKSWQMSGETSSRFRSENSLLEEDLIYDHVSRPAPEITEEVTHTLEDIIKQRIKDQAWDDVVRKEKPKEQPYNYHVLHPLDQEKSKLSLAEIYEREYIKQTQVEKEERKNPKHEDIQTLMNKIFTELDALANYHFTPNMPEPEIKTVPNLPSVMLEEVAPVSHSDTTLLAPEELQDKSDRPEMGKSERSITDKKRERRRKKKYQHVNKEKLQKIKERKNRLKKTSSADIQAIKSSNKFFAQLTETVQSHVRQKKDLMNERRTDKNKKKLLHLKL